jgi:hypothetical protein
LFSVFTFATTSSIAIDIAVIVARITIASIFSIALYLFLGDEPVVATVVAITVVVSTTTIIIGA